MTGIAAFQVAAAAGAPVGAFTQGGVHHGRLPTPQRAVASASSVLCLGFVGAALDHGGVIDVVPDHVSRRTMWAVTGFLGLNTLANLASRSPDERRVMTPISLGLAALAGSLIRSKPLPCPPSPR